VANHKKKFLRSARNTCFFSISVTLSGHRKNEGRNKKFIRQNYENQDKEN